MTDKYSGWEWIKAACKTEPSELGKEVADILGQVYRGIYHIEKPARKVDWSNKYWIVICLYGDMATFDGQVLTELVVMCHDRAIRMEISGAAPNYLRLMFHRRTRFGTMISRHPTIEDAIERIRDLIGLGLVEDTETSEGIIL
jgi:hypothetical protein